MFYDILKYYIKLYYMSTDILLIFAIIVFLVYAWMMQQDYMTKQKQYIEKKEEILRAMMERSTKKPNTELAPTSSNIPLNNERKMTDRVATRDTNVLEDPLYPPLGRMPRPIADQYLDFKDKRLIGVSTRYDQDTYRLMAYMINKTDKNDKWNVYGRQKYRGSSTGEFYAIQQCNSTTHCTKIDLNSDIIVGNTFNDFYNLPNTVTLQSPLFSTEPYDVVQLKTTVDTGPYY